MVHFNLGLSLRCGFSSNVEYHAIGSPYRCEVNNLTVTSDDHVVSEVTGKHESEKKNSDVKLVLFQEQNLPNFPDDIHKFFTNVEGLIIDDSSLKSISKTDLVNFPKLKLLVITNNKIDKIENDLFEGCPDIEYLVFKNNYTKHIGREILSSLLKLKIANFERNTCISQKATNVSEIYFLKEEIGKKCQ